MKEREEREKGGRGMKKKNLVWLLTAAMVAGSVEGPVAVASGAEFSAGPEEVQETETVVEESVHRSRTFP